MSTTRIITVVSTGGSAAVQDYTTSATTLGEFLRETGINIDNKVITESKNKTTLNNLDSVLPEGNFNMFIKNKKTKSGNINFMSMTFTELKAFIMSNPDAKNYINIKAKEKVKNWTQLSIEDRREFLSEWQKSASKGNTNTVSNGKKPATKQFEEIPVEEANSKTKKESTKVSNNEELLQQALDSIHSVISSVETSKEIKIILKDCTTDLEVALKVLKGDMSAHNYLAEKTKKAEEDRKAALLREAADLESTKL